MKRLLLILCSMLAVCGVRAQDFADKYMSKHREADLTCIGVSTTMMGEILSARDVEQDTTGILDIISKLTSMRLISTGKDAATHFQQAEELARSNPARFEEMAAYDQAEECCRIFVRKRKKTVVELVMIHREDTQFTLIDLTGEMSAKTMKKLAHIFLPPPPDKS